MNDPTPPRNRLGVGAGLGMTFALHGVAIAILFGLIILPEFGVYFLVALPFLGLVQFLYMIPAILIARKRGQPNLAKGLIIGAAATFLLNAGCWALVTIPSIMGMG